MFDKTNIRLQNIHFDEINDSSINLSMARLEHNHALASGNKLYKLKPIIEYAKVNNFKQILSFGGAFSNHIHALALMANAFQIESIAVIRGEPEYTQNPTLSDAQNAGMELLFVSREEYKQRNNADYLQELKHRFPQALIIPEGGSHPLAIQGCAQMARDINAIIDSDALAIATGTGATAAGLVCGLKPQQQLNVYAILKDESLNQRIDAFIAAETNRNNSHQHQHQYTIHSADFGRYAKLDKHLLAFILSWLEQTGILLDPIYTSKMCMRVVQQIKAGDFKLDQSLTLIHSGGLQGWRGMQTRVENLAGKDAWKRINDQLS